jgi:hypothetical protein
MIVLDISGSMAEPANNGIKFYAGLAGAVVGLALGGYQGLKIGSYLGKETGKLVE